MDGLCWFLIGMIIGVFMLAIAIAANNSRDEKKRREESSDGAFQSLEDVRKQIERQLEASKYGVISLDVDYTIEKIDDERYIIRRRI